MGFAFVDLHWSPNAFWTATPHELFAAYEVIEARSKARRQA